MSGLKTEAHPTSSVLIEGVGSGGSGASVFFAGGYDQNPNWGVDQIVMIAGTAQPSIVMAGYGFTQNGSSLLINDTVNSKTIGTVFGGSPRKHFITYGFADTILSGKTIIGAGGIIQGQDTSTGALHDMLCYTSGDIVALKAGVGGGVALMENGGNAKVTVDSTGLGFYAVAPVARSTGWSVSNVTTDKVLNANATSIDELADVLGTLITALISVGLLGA